MEYRMASEIILKKIDEVFMQVQCDDGLARDLHDFFSFTVPNAKFMPSVKHRYWDGKVRLFSIKTNKIYIGLLPYVDEFCRERGYDIKGINDIIGNKERQPNEEFIGELGLPFEPRDYQLEAFRSAVQYGRQLLLSPTASGKSLIIYLLARYYNKRPAPSYLGQANLWVKKLKNLGSTSYFLG